MRSAASSLSRRLRFSIFKASISARISTEAAVGAVGAGAAGAIACAGGAAGGVKAAITVPWVSAFSASLATLGGNSENLGMVMGLAQAGHGTVRPPKDSFTANLRSHCGHRKRISAMTFPLRCPVPDFRWTPSLRKLFNQTHFPLPA